MKWVIQSGKGILKNNLGQWLVFDTADLALDHIKVKCANSPYLVPIKILEVIKFNKH